MWIPQTAEEVERAATNGDINETAIFDAKALPSSSKEIAKDVAAMANDGGVLLYGVGEDENGQPTKLTPFALDGEPERIQNIVSSGCSEPPTIQIIPLRTSADSSLGYLVVHIPASPRAPHLVIIGKENRFYGRTATGNTPLNEGDISRLYRRREQWEVDRDRLLDDVINRAPFPKSWDLGYLHMFVRPVVPDEALLDRARRDIESGEYIRGLINVARSPEVYPIDTIWPNFYPPDLMDQHVDGILGQLGASTNQGGTKEARDSLDVTVNYNGSTFLFCGRAAERRDTEHRLLFEPLIAQVATRFLKMTGDLYTAALYASPVDVGLAITGIEGALTNYTTNARAPWFRKVPFNQDVYRHTARVLPKALADDPKAVAKHLLARLFRITVKESFDPFQP